jgi:hypothetical protein
MLAAFGEAFGAHLSTTLAARRAATIRRTQQHCASLADALTAPEGSERQTPSLRFMELAIAPEWSRLSGRDRLFADPLEMVADHAGGTPASSY